MEKASNKFLVFLAILATPFALGAFVLSWQPANQYFDFAPQYDGYVAPRDISGVVDQTQASTVTVYCRISKDDGSLGTAWAIDDALLQIPSKQTTLMTNHHVIDSCINGKGKVTVAKLYKKEFPASILYYDKKNDLAVLGTDLKLSPLDLSENFMWSGYWVMTLGSAAGFEGSVSFGNIINTTATDVLITNNISEGNSGGPLIDNEGKVVGIVTWSSDNDGEQFNGAGSLDTFCEKIIKCDYVYKDQKVWYNYNDE